MANSNSSSIEGVSKYVFIPESMYTEVVSKMQKLEVEVDEHKFTARQNSQPKAEAMSGGGVVVTMTDLPKPPTALVALNTTAAQGADPVGFKTMDSESNLADGYQQDMPASTVEAIFDATKKLAHGASTSSGAGPATPSKKSRPSSTTQTKRPWFFLGRQESDDGETTTDSD